MRSGVADEALTSLEVRAREAATLHAQLEQRGEEAAGLQGELEAMRQEAASLSRKVAIATDSPLLEVHACLAGCAGWQVLCGVHACRQLPGCHFPWRAAPAVHLQLGATEDAHADVAGKLGQAEALLRELQAAAAALEAQTAQQHADLAAKVRGDSVSALRCAHACLGRTPALTSNPARCSAAVELIPLRTNCPSRRPSSTWRSARPRKPHSARLSGSCRWPQPGRGCMPS